MKATLIFVAALVSVGVLVAVSASPCGTAEVGLDAEGRLVLSDCFNATTLGGLLDTIQQQQSTIQQLNSTVQQQQLQTQQQQATIQQLQTCCVRRSICPSRNSPSPSTAPWTGSGSAWTTRAIWLLPTIIAAAAMTLTL
eukprot:m.269584 g.269584  ORF g.269584 m.269584 type:complete len:139 (-) comp22822_c0_seq4:59-475(-)